MVVPLVITDYPPLIDYPNHLARAFTVAHYLEVPAFSRWFTFRPQPVPNLGMDVVAVPMLWVIRDPFLAGRIVLALIGLLHVAACHALSVAVLGRLSWRGTAAGFWLYSSTFLWGFLNYTIAVALFFLGFALWVQWRRRWTFLRLCIMGLCCLACYFAHLSGLAFLGVSLPAFSAVSCLLGERRCARQLALDFSPLAWPGIAFLTGPLPRSTGNAIWNDLEGKLIYMAALIRTYSMGVDVVLLVATAAVALLLWKKCSSWTVNRPLAAAACGLLLAFLLTPKGSFLGSDAVDARYVLPFAVLALFAADGIVRQRHALALVFIALFCLRHAAILQTWSHLSLEIREVVLMFDALPPESSVAVFFSPAAGGPDAEKMSHSFRHVPSYATLTRQAVTSNAFTDENAFWIGWRNPWPDGTTPRVGDTPLRRACSSHAFVWAFNPESNLTLALAAAAELTTMRGPAQLWRCKPASP